MTNLIPIIFWSCFGLSAILSIIALIRLRVPRERGPWLVCRVAADGSGGVEFYVLTMSDDESIWTKFPISAIGFKFKESAERVANNLIADVVPLSRYINPPSKGSDSLMEGLREAKEHIDGTKKHPVKRVGKGVGK